MMKYQLLKSSFNKMNTKITIKFCQYLLLFLIASGNAQADYWTQKADFGGSPRCGAVAFSIDNTGYVGTGSFTKDVWEYNPVTNSWLQKADCPGKERWGAIGLSINNKG